MNSYTKKRMIQSLNESLEKRYVQEKTQKINLVNEGLWDRLVSNAAGFFNRFRTFGQNFGAIFGGGLMMNPNMEAAYARVRQRATSMQKELTDLEIDLKMLYDEANKAKVEKRVDKLGDKRRGDELGNRLENLDESMTKYLEAISQMKTFNEAFLNSVGKA